MIAFVSGSRTITQYEVVAEVLERAWFEITELCHGDQPGIRVNGKFVETVDRLAGRWARTNNIPVTPFPANWNLYGKSAGPRRNQEMSDAAKKQRDNVFLIAIWDGSSTGTADCFKRFHAANLPIFQYNRATGIYNYYRPK